MRSRIGLVNAAGLGAALAVALVAASYGAHPAPAAARPPLAAVETVALPGGGRGVRDATGEVVELRPYRRILAASTVADRLLHELAEPDRIVAVTAFGRAESPWAYQQADKPTLAGVDDLEAVLALAPDLVVLNSYGATGKVTRLREHGIAVFDLGEMRGAAVLVRDIHVVATLLGHPERGQRLAASWQRRFAAVAAALGSRPRRRAVYVATYGGKLFGGTRDSSYGDVLTAAGLIDAAAAAGYRGWPQYAIEQLLGLDPELIVTKPGMPGELCRIPGLDRLRPCRLPGGFAEVEAAVLDDPGLPMLDAAEAIAAAAYPTIR
ncbi:MAG TPA: ABC transporter substrate-binding protein [Kofleriaceae bacterium]|nr:ABC transporter substrate-binding protein [Kofleriaceae bacterium]